ncbi:MAG: aminoacyl-tRNA hydrolase [Patescibacteria group bacterium]
MFYIIGLGNPGDEYVGTRHNTGRMAVDFFEKKNEISPKKLSIIHSNEFMNNSGKAVSKIIKSKKAAENLIVVHDDIDLPIGTMKISFNKGTGGHRGLDSIVKVVKTKEFVRIRIGVSPSNSKGVVKKPNKNLTPKAGEKAIIDFILNKFKPAEMEIMKKNFKKISEAIQTLVSDGRDRAMNTFNS